MPPVTSTQTAVEGNVLRAKPYCTLPSLVPTRATVVFDGAKASWLMKERAPSVPLQRLGLMAVQLEAGMAPLSVSQTRLLPAIMWSQVAPGQL